LIPVFTPGNSQERGGQSFVGSGLWPESKRLDPICKIEPASVERG